MIHVIAIVGLAVFCMIWFLLQQWTGRAQSAGCSGKGDGSCERSGEPKKGSCGFCGPHED